MDFMAVDATKLVGAVLIVAALAYSLVVETRWFATKFGTGYLRAFGSALFGFLIGVATFFAVGALFKL